MVYPSISAINQPLESCWVHLQGITSSLLTQIMCYILLANANECLCKIINSRFFFSKALLPSCYLISFYMIMSLIYLRSFIFLWLPLHSLWFPLRMWIYHLIYHVFFISLPLGSMLVSWVLLETLHHAWEYDKLETFEHTYFLIKVFFYWKPGITHGILTKGNKH
jgi:hypothetical protein